MRQSHAICIIKKKRDRTWYICAFVLIQYRDFQTKNVRMTPNLSSRSSVLPPPFLFLFFLLLLKYDRLTESPTHVSYIYIGLKTWGNIKHSVLAWLVNKGGQRVVVLPRDEKLKVVGKFLKNVFQSYNTHFVKRLWNLPFKIDYEISWKWQTFCFCIKKTGTFKNDIVVRPFGFPVPVCTRPLESLLLALSTTSTTWWPHQRRSIRVLLSLKNFTCSNKTIPR